MPRNKKKWIDKRRATTYTLVQRSEPDPRTAHFDTVPINEYDSDEEIKYTKSMGAPGGFFVSKTGKVVPSEAVLQQEIGETVMSSVGRDLLDEEADPEILKALAAADEDDENVEGLPDDFVTKALQDNPDLSDTEGPVLGSYGKYDDIDDDLGAPATNFKEKEEKDTTVKNAVKVIRDTEDDDSDDEVDDNNDYEDDNDDDEDVCDVDDIITQRQRTIIDDLFDAELRKFDADEEYKHNTGDNFGKTENTETTLPGFDDEFDDDDIDDDDLNTPGLNRIQGLCSPDSFENIFDGFLGDNVLIRYEPPPKEEVNALLPNGSDDEHEDERLEEIFVKEKNSEWDIESIISTYSNTDNHPKLITVEIDAKAKIILKRGIPQIFTKPDGKDTPPSQESPANSGQARRKNESKALKKERKQQVKQCRKENRIRKKELKLVYKEEELRIRHQRVATTASGSLVNTSIIQY